MKIIDHIEGVFQRHAELLSRDVHEELTRLVKVAARELKIERVLFGNGTYAVVGPDFDVQDENDEPGDTFPMDLGHMFDSNLSGVTNISLRTQQAIKDFDELATYVIDHPYLCVSDIIL